MNVSQSLEEIALDQENQSVKVSITKEVSDLVTCGRDLASANKSEIELPYWIAIELVSGDIAKLRDEDKLNPTGLSKIHWRETIPTSRQLPSVQPNFYHPIKSFLLDLGRRPEKARELEKAKALFQDIVNCRLRKIITLAASSGQTEALSQNMCAEEKALYNTMSAIISKWKERMLRVEPD